MQHQKTLASVVWNLAYEI